MQLSNARAVITGGVSGLGFAVAQHLVANGGKVALFDVNDDKGAAAVAGIASSLSLGLVAEGIETEAQRDFMIRLGVKVGQGFLFAPGLLPGEFAKRVIAQQD